VTDRPTNPYDAPKAPSADDWRHAFVPLGVSRAEGWQPVGAGVLLVDSPIVWLVTARSVLEAAGGSPIVAWVGTSSAEKGEGHAFADLTTGRTGDLAWLRHPERDLAACVFPIGPTWRVKAFSEARTLLEPDLQPLLPACVVGTAWGLGAPGQRPVPLALDGTLAGIDPGARTIITTAPLLPRNAGGPLLVQLPAQAGGGVALAGIATHSVTVSEGVQSTLPPVRLTIAAPIALAFELIRSAPGKAARKAALASGKPA
jgi:hypothetical protein